MTTGVLPEKSSRNPKYRKLKSQVAEGTGTNATSALTDMFTSTGGTFTGTPEINMTYYLSSDNMVVRDTEVSTLNGYVGSMIDSSIGNRVNGLVTNMINRTTSVDEPDTSYQTYMARGEALFSSTTSPTANGAIAWQYS